MEVFGGQAFGDGILLECLAEACGAAEPDIGLLPFRNQFTDALEVLNRPGNPGDRFV